MIDKTAATTRQYDQLIEVLGRDYVNEKVESSYDFIHLASKGLDAGIITNLRKYFNLSRAMIARILDISEPTLYRWIRSNKKLERNYSIKIFEVTDLFLYGSEVFGSQDDFFKWMELQNIVLGGMEPQELLDIPGGMAKVRDELGRIEHGVHA